MIWSLGQTLGPYPLHPHERGPLAWGFIVDQFNSQPVVCIRDGRWKEHGTLQTGEATQDRHVEVQIKPEESLRL